MRMAFDDLKEGKYMKKTGLSFAAGIVVGALVFGGTAAIAAGIMATPSTNAIWVNGVEVEPQAYLIESNNYMKLRDIAAAVDFSVVWDGANNRVLIDTSRGYDANETVAVAAPVATTTPKSTLNPVATPVPTVAPTPVVTPTSAPTPAPTATPKPNLLPNGVPILSDAERREKELEVIRLVNIERENVGLKPLTVNEDLCVVARIKTDEMVELKYFAHESPTYGKPKNMIKAFRISCKDAGEAIGRSGGTIPSGVVWGWMHSEPHKELILDPKLTQAGVGLTSDGEGLGYWSIMLIN